MNAGVGAGAGAGRAPEPPLLAVARAADRLGAFVDYAAARRLELYPAQEEAILALLDGQNVILNTPTGSGKSLVAAALHADALGRGRRSVYTCPIKALVNEKFLSLCRDFGPENVGMSTGDAAVNPRAPILCCTAEVLANQALRAGEHLDVADVAMDEFHYYGDRERGAAWQIPLLTLRRTRFLLMSATMGRTDFFAEKLTALNGRPSAVVQSVDRPVPLEFSYSETPLEETIAQLVADRRAPIYLVHFTQAAAAERAQALTSLGLTTREEREALGAALDAADFRTPYGPELKRLLRQGIGIHHAGLLPRYRVLVERLAQQGLLKVVCGTDTLGVGVNVPIRTVVLTQLCKFDGEKWRILPARDFHQICGRAGRRGFDEKGWVVVQAPEHVIENKRLEQKAAADPAKRKKFVRRAPPAHNFVNWDEKTYARLLVTPPEPLASHFDVSHGLLLNVLARPDDGCAALRRLIADCHEAPPAQARLRRRAWQLFRSLVEKRIVEILPRAARPPSGAKVRVHEDLQRDFSLHETLGIWLVDTLAHLDPAAPDYALDVLSLCEAIVEDPEPILRRQLDRAKAERLAALKAEGVEYERRMAELDTVEYPKPRRDFIYDSFNAFAAAHPWIGQENIRPKSIAREMAEKWRSFADYVRDYDLQRIEGVLLRHLASVHKTLAQTVPETAKTEAVREIETWLREIVRGTDASLLEEWEQLRHPAASAPATAGAGAVAETSPRAAIGLADVTRDRDAFRRLTRLAILEIVALLAQRRWDDAATRLEAVPGDAAWTGPRLEAALAPWLATHERIRLDPEARNARHSHFDFDPHGDGPHRLWRIEQVLVDPMETNDWSLRFRVDLAAARAAGRPVLALESCGPIGSSA